MKMLVSLQYLRAMGPIGVLLVHALERCGWRFDVDQMGVDIFFVLSGLMMWLIAERTPRTPAQFFADRLGQMMHAPDWLAVALMVAGGVGFGVAAHLLVEKPIRNRLCQRRKPGDAPVLSPQQPSPL